MRSGENVATVWSRARSRLMAGAGGGTRPGGRSSHRIHRGAKEIEDKVLAALALVALLPVMVLIALAVLAESPGPVLYRQRRRGCGGRPFIVYKFRTMRVDSEAMGFRQAVRDDPRVTRVGRFLRRSSLDELPQLFNVLAGTMSLIGPRPHPVELDRQFAHLIDGFDRRLAVKPGITGLAQVRGYRGETVDLESMRRRIEFDLKYIDEWSLLLDLRILLATPFSCLTTENAY